MEAACLVRRLGLPQGEEALKARLRRPGHPRLREALAAYLKRLQAPEEVFRALERLEVGAVVICRAYSATEALRPAACCWGVCARGGDG